MDALEKAKQAVGGTVALARRLSDAGQPITPQAISQWRRVPAVRADLIEQVTGVSKRDLRPDLWGPAQ